MKFLSCDIILYDFTLNNTIKYSCLIALSQDIIIIHLVARWYIFVDRVLLRRQFRAVTQMPRKCRSIDSWPIELCVQRWQRIWHFVPSNGEVKIVRKARDNKQRTFNLVILWSTRSRDGCFCERELNLWNFNADHKCCKNPDKGTNKYPTTSTSYQENLLKLVVSKEDRVY